MNSLPAEPLRSEAPGPRREPLRDAISGLDWAIAGLFLAVMLALRWCFISAHPWNSDEAQHMHIVWTWANGLLPYRDVFDNHSPLFSWAFSPLLRALGERADIVEAMRYAMWPLFGVSLWAIYRLGAIFFGARTGLWAALLSGLLPAWFLKMGEFRTDVLWTTCWLVTLVILVSGRLSPWRLFFSGLAMGICFSVSMKSTLLLLTVALAAGVAWLMQRWLAPAAAREKFSGPGFLAGSLCALAGLVVVPSLFVAFFAAHGSLGQLYYCIIEHNVLPGRHSLGHALGKFKSVKSLIVLPALAVGWAMMPLFATERARASRRLFFLLVAGFFLPVLYGLWSMITPQDFMPLLPFAGLLIAPPLLWLANLAAQRTGIGALAAVLPMLAPAGQLAWLLKTTHPLTAANTSSINRIAKVLALTHPGEFVMDAKGESIFRPRPYYFVLETLTRKRIARKLLTDDMPQRLLETRTAVLLPSERMGSVSAKFVASNYIPVGDLHVLGMWLGETKPARFEVHIPAQYCVVGKNGPAAGTLDGVPLEGLRFLEAGPHEWVGSDAPGKVALVWERAAARKFSPFDAPTPRGTIQ